MRRNDVRLKVGADFSPFKKKMRAMENRMRKSINRLEVSGRRMFTTITLPVVAFGASAIQSAAKIDKLKKGLQGIMGNASLAAEEFKKLRKVAKNPGLDLASAVKGSVKLQSIGFSADKARHAIETFANAVALAGGSGDDLNGVTTAIQQIISKGKVHAEEINQMAERLPQVRSAMIDAFGTANTEVLQKMKISAASFVDTIVEGLSDLDKAPDNLANKLSNLKDEFTLISAQIGAKLFPIFNKLMGVVLKAVGWFSSLSSSTQAMIGKVILLAAVLGPLKLAFAAFGQVAFSIGKAVMAIATSPLAWVLIAVAAAVYAIYKNWGYVKKRIVEVVNYFIDLYNESLAFKTLVVNLVHVFNQMWAIVKAIGQGIFTMGKALWAWMKNPWDSSVKEKMMADFEEIGKTLKDSTEDSFEDMMAKLKTKDKIKFITEADVDNAVAPLKKMVTDTKRWFLGLFKGGGIGGGTVAEKGVKVKTSRIGTQQGQVESKVGPDRQAEMTTPVKPYEWDKEDYLEWAEGFMGAMEKIADVMQSVFNQIDGIMNQHFDNKKLRIENDAQRQIDAVNNSLLLEEDKSKQLEGIEKVKARKLRALRRKEAISTKTLAIFDSVLNGIRATQSALATGGIPLAAIVGTLAAVQTGLAIAQPLPALARGGAAFGPTQAIIGDNPNASIDPEVVAPFSKVTNMFDTYAARMMAAGGRGGQSGRLYGELTASGEDLHLLIGNQDIRKGRKYGKAV